MRSLPPGSLFFEFRGDRRRPGNYATTDSSRFFHANADSFYASHLFFSLFVLLPEPGAVQVRPNPPAAPFHCLGFHQ